MSEDVLIKLRIFFTRDFTIVISTMFLNPQYNQSDGYYFCRKSCVKLKSPYSTRNRVRVGVITTQAKKETHNMKLTCPTRTQRKLA